MCAKHEDSHSATSDSFKLTIPEEHIKDLDDIINEDAEAKKKRKSPEDLFDFVDTQNLTEDLNFLSTSHIENQQKSQFKDSLFEDNLLTVTKLATPMKHKDTKQNKLNVEMSLFSSSFSANIPPPPVHSEIEPDVNEFSDDFVSGSHEELKLNSSHEVEEEDKVIVQDPLKKAKEIGLGEESALKSKVVEKTFEEKSLDLSLDFEIPDDQTEDLLKTPLEMNLNDIPKEPIQHPLEEEEFSKKSSDRSPRELSNHEIPQKKSADKSPKKSSDNEEPPKNSGDTFPKSLEEKPHSVVVGNGVPSKCAEVQTHFPLKYEPPAQQKKVHFNFQEEKRLSDRMELEMNQLEMKKFILDRKAAQQHITAYEKELNKLPPSSEKQHQSYQSPPKKPNESKILKKDELRNRAIFHKLIDQREKERKAQEEEEKRLQQRQKTARRIKKDLDILRKESEERQKDKHQPSRPKEVPSYNAERVEQTVTLMRRDFDDCFLKELRNHKMKHVKASSVRQRAVPIEASYSYVPPKQNYKFYPLPDGS